MDGAWTPPLQSETAECLETNCYFIRFDSILSCELLMYGQIVKLTLFRAR